MSFREFWVVGFMLLAGCGRGFVVVGAGETIDHLASFDDATKAQLQVESGFADPAVGLKYEFFSLFFLRVWNWEGEVVIYERGGDEYLELSDEALREYTGRSADAFDRPFFYRFPMGLVAIVLFLLAGVLGIRQRMRSLDRRAA